MIRNILAAWMFCFALSPMGWGQSAVPPIQWQATYGGSLNDILHCLQQTPDGGYIVGGRSIALPGTGTKTSPSYGNYDYWLIRLDADGRQLWDRSYGGIMYDALRSIRQTPDGGFLLAGFTESPAGGNKTSPYIGPRNFWVVRVDADGNKLWERAYGGTGGDTLAAMRMTPDGGFILAGTSTSSPGGTKTALNYGWNSRDFWIVRLNANGDQLWDRSFGTTGDDDLRSIELTADGGFVLGGTAPVGPSGNKTSDNFGGPDFWIIRLDGNGNKLWEQSFGGWGTDELYSVVATGDGGFMLGGTSDSAPSGTKTSSGFGGTDLWVVRVDALGNKLWDRSYGGDGHDNFMDTFTMQKTTDGGFILGTGTGGNSNNGNKTAPNYGANDMWVVHIDAAGNKLWDQSYGASDTDVVNAIQQTADGGFLFGGQSYSDRSGNKTAARQGGADYWVVKVGSSAPVINQLPTLTSLPSTTVDEDVATGPITFTVADVETPAGSLTVTARSSNPVLIPDNRIQLGGTGASRTLNLLPLTNQFGTATISVVVADAHGGQATNAFLLTVRSVADAPGISPLPGLILVKNAAATAVAIAISDAETPAANLSLTVHSANTGVIPQSGLVIDGSGSTRTLRITPAVDQLGTSLLTITVNDGSLTSSTSFEVSVQEVAPIHPNLVSHWKLDEVSGTVALDAMGRNPGVLVNSPERIAGRVGSALRFNGANNYVNIPDSASLDLGSRLTISLWLKPNTLLNGASGRKDLFKKFVSYWLILNYPASDGKLSFVLNSGAPILSSTTSEWLPDRWYHIVATYDGSFLRLYIDGTLENSLAANTIPMVNGYPVQIGGNSEQSIYFPGAVDDVRLFDAPLSAAEVRQLALVSPPAANQLPQISTLSNLVRDEDATPVEVTFTVSDGETPPTSLVVAASASNAALLPPAALQLGGTGASRTLRLSPAANQSGQSTVTVTVSDSDGGSATNSFLITVNPINDAPAITALVDQAIEQDRSAGPLAFSINDQETAATSLTLRGQSSNQGLLLNAGISFAGSAASRSVTLTPLPGKVGSTEVTLWVSDGSIEQSTTFLLTVTATNGPAGETAFVTRTVAGNVRNDFTGWVGYRITIGANPVQVTALGRFAYPNDKESHVVKIVRAANGVDVPGASATVLMSGATPAQWKFVSLNAAVTLPANESFYVVSDERSGGDRFGDLNTTIETTTVASQNSAVYAAGGPNYISVAGPSRVYGPPNFRYQTAGGPPIPPTPAAPTVSLVAPTAGTIVTLPGQVTLQATVSSDVTNTTFWRDGILLGSDVNKPATFVWANPLVGTYALTARVLNTNGLGTTSSVVNITVRTNGGAGQNYVVTTALGELRSDFSGFVGMKITVGSLALSAREVGRMIAPGNTGAHVVKFVRASDLVDVGAATVTTINSVAGQFKYAPLPSPAILAPHTMYYLVTQEVNGGDRWYGVMGTTLTTLDVATIASGVFMGDGYGWSLAGSAQHSYGPVDFKFEVVDLPVAGGMPSNMVTKLPSGRLTPSMIKGRLVLTIAGLAGQRYLFEASTDLDDWQPLTEQTLERDEIAVVDLEADSRSFRFYRATLLP